MLIFFFLISNVLTNKFAPYLSTAEESCIEANAKLLETRGDEKFAENVQEYNFTRPGAEWNCGLLCLSKPKGTRGQDLWLIPKGATCKSPRILYLHGGSWITGSPFTRGIKSYTSFLARDANAVVLSLDYPLAPTSWAEQITEHMIAALQYLEHNVPVGGLSCTNQAESLFVGGDSAGATSALTVSLAIERGYFHGLVKPKLSGIFMWSGWYHLASDSPDYYNKQYAKVYDRIVGENSYVGDLFFQMSAHASTLEFKANALLYVQSIKDMYHELYSPMSAPKSLLKSLPPLFFIAAGNEINLGEIIVMSQRTANAGVNTFTDVYASMFHDFQIFSEGCKNELNEPLWSAITARERVIEWITHIATNGKPPCEHVGSLPRMQWHYLEPGSTGEWYPFGLCGE